MFDDFCLFAPVVINFPLRKNQLHEMRKAGKPLRYAMELGEYCFTPDFKLCLDVMIPDISLHMKEVRLFNQTIKDGDQRLSTRQLRSSVQHLRKQRRELYAELCNKLKLWNENNFRARIVAAMSENTGQVQ